MLKDLEREVQLKPEPWTSSASFVARFPDLVPQRALGRSVWDLDFCLHQWPSPQASSWQNDILPLTQRTDTTCTTCTTCHNVVSHISTRLHRPQHLQLQRLATRNFSLRCPSSATLIGRPSKALYDPHVTTGKGRSIQVFSSELFTSPWEWKMKEIATWRNVNFSVNIVN